MALDRTEHHDFGIFRTFVERELPDGRVEQWASRLARKSATTSGGAESGTWWDPRARGWWIGVLFAIGSALFALGTIPAYVDAVGRFDAVTFFIGSIFFTAAGFLQYRESVDAGPEGPQSGWAKVLVFRPHQIDWVASAIQLVGTLWFNLSTANTMRVALSVAQQNHRVWRPDALGSICFLIASTLAWMEVSHGWWSFSPRSFSWWITLLNLVGSIAFGISAIEAHVLSSNQLRNAGLANLGTFIGAMCFLIGAVLLLPERTQAHTT